MTDLIESPHQATKMELVNRSAQKDRAYKGERRPLCYSPGKSSDGDQRSGTIKGRDKTVANEGSGQPILQQKHAGMINCVDVQGSKHARSE